MRVRLHLAAVLLLVAPPVHAEATWPAAAVVPGSPPAAPALDGRRLLLDCEKQFLRLESVQGTVRARSLVHGGGFERSPVAERLSEFVYARDLGVRFENAAPLPHTVVWDGESVRIWSPGENAFVSEPAERVSPHARALLSVQPGFGMDLLAPVPLDAYRASAAAAPAGTTDGDVVVTLVPLDAGGERATLRFVVDSARKRVTRILALSERGTPVSDVRLVEPVEARPGIWIATRLEMRQLLADGSTLEELRTFERLRFDAPVSRSVFELEAPANALRVSVDALAGTVRAGGGRGTME